jgi:hypothetical protein
MRTTTRLTLGLLVLLALAPRADAQMLQWNDRGYFTFSLGVQPQSRSFTESSTLAIYEETASITVPHTISSGLFFDVSGGARVWQNFGAGIAYSRFSDKESPMLTAQIPNPSTFAAPRSVILQPLGELKREESAVHIQLLWMLPVSNKIEIAGFFGPSFYKVKQGLATLSLTDIVEVPPSFSTVTVRQATVSQADESKTGINVGLDGTYRITALYGVGGFIRFAGTSIELALPGGGTTTVDVGGFQMGGGLRVRF